MLDIQIKIKRGSLTIKPSQDDQLHVEARPDLVPEIRGNSVTFDAEYIVGPVHATILVPVPLGHLDANLGRGPLHAEHLNVVSGDINLGLGNLSVTQCRGKWDVNVGKGDALVDGIDGDLDINLGMGKLEMSGLRGQADINNGLGAVWAKNCDGHFEVNAGKGDIIWAEASGGSLEMNAGLGSVRVERGHGTRLEVNAGLGKVGIENSNWAEACIETGLGDIIASGSFSQLEITAKQRGAIQVSLPEGVGARVEASTDRGRIVSHLNLIPVGHAGPQRGQRLVGVLGDGRGQVTLHTHRGDIMLSQGTEANRSTSTSGDLQADPDSQRALILQRLSEGGLTVDEAEALLEALD